MYLCVCHAVTDRHVKETARTSGGTVGSVLRELGVRPRCKHCGPFIKAAVEAARRETAAAEPVASIVPAE